MEATPARRPASSASLEQSGEIEGLQQHDGRAALVRTRAERLRRRLDHLLEGVALSRRHGAILLRLPQRLSSDRQLPVYVRVDLSDLVVLLQVSTDQIEQAPTRRSERTSLQQESRSASGP
jgi:hypothetical protein